MTRKEFEESKEPLIFIVSINPGTGKALYDAYPYDVAEAMRADFEEDFPDMLHFQITNKAGIAERRKLYNFPSTDKEEG